MPLGLWSTELVFRAPAAFRASRAQPGAAVGASAAKSAHHRHPPMPMFNFVLVGGANVRTRSPA